MGTSNQFEILSHNLPKHIYTLAAANIVETTVQYDAEKKDLEKRLITDSLTGVSNRDGMEYVLENSRPPKAILYVDSTNQKAINDNINHKRGDEAIIGTAEVIIKSVRPEDTVARIGGDEFLVLLSDEARDPDVGQREPTEILSPVIDRISDETQKFLKLNPDLVAQGFNIAVGGAVWEEGMHVKDVVAAAEKDMFATKAVQHANGGKHR